MAEPKRCDIRSLITALTFQKILPLYICDEIRSYVQHQMDSEDSAFARIELSSQSLDALRIILQRNMSLGQALLGCLLSPGSTDVSILRVVLQVCLRLSLLSVYLFLVFKS